MHRCILSAGDDRYCSTELEFRIFLHWLVSHETAVKLALTDVEEDRDVWKVRAVSAESQQGLSLTAVMLIIGGIAAALGVGFGAGYGVALVKGK